MQKQEEKQYSYFVEADLLEMGRQLLQSSVISHELHELDELFGKQPDTVGICNVLDLACGPGGWTSEAATAFRQVCFTGIDIDPIVLEYARARMWANSITNTDFQVMNVLEPLQFADASFDIIYGRFLLGFMRRGNWPTMIKECLRILKPGGQLLLTEGDTWTISQSPALAAISTNLYQALWHSDQAFCADGRGAGVSPMLPFFLEEAGYEQIGVSFKGINISYGTPAYPAMVQDTLLLIKRLQPFLQKYKIVTTEELDILYYQALEEIRRPTYRAFWYITRASGRKPFR